MTRYPYAPVTGSTLLRPAVPVVALYGERARPFRALLDSGAPLTVVDRITADRLAVPIGRKGAERTQIQLLGGTWEVQFEHLDLSLVGSDEAWSARVGFVTSPALRMPFQGLLGSSGFFDRYVVTFAQYHGWVQVEHASNVPPV